MDRSEMGAQQRRAVQPAVTTGLSVLFVAIAFVRPAAVPQQVLFLFFFLYLVLVPGYFISRRICGNVALGIGLLVAFITGSAMLYIVLFVFDLAGVGTKWIAIVHPIIIIAVSTLDALRPASSSAAAQLFDGLRPGRKERIVLIALLLSVVAAAMISRDPLLYSGDSLDHIAYVRTISRTGEVFPERFYYPDGGLPARDIRKGMWNACIGALSSLTGSNDVHMIWPFIALIGLFFMTLALSCAGLLLFRSCAVGITSALLFLLLYRGSMSGNLMATITFPFNFGKICYISALAFLPWYLSSGRMRYMLLITICLLVATWTHIAHLMIFLFLLAIAFLVYGIRASHGSRGSIVARSWKLALALIASNAPYLLVRYIRDYHPNNPIHSHAQGIMLFTDSLYIVNPAVVMQGAGTVGVLALLALLLLWRRARDESALALLLAGTAASYILLMNPLWVPFLMGRLSYLLFRFEFTAPSMIVAACLLRTLFVEITGRERRLPRPVSIAAALIVAVLIGSQAARLPARAAAALGESPQKNRRSSYALVGLYDAINREISPGSVIASDPVTSYCIPAFTDMYVMCPYDQHSTPNDSTALRRLADSRRIFASGDDPAAIIAVMAKYDSRYLALNGTIPENVQTMFWKPNRDSYDRLVSALDEHPLVFERIYGSDGIALYRIEATGRVAPADSTARMEAWIGTAVPPSEEPNLTTSGCENISISRVGIYPAEAERGDTAEIEIEWVRTGPVPHAGFVCYARFDTDFDKGPLYHESYGKICRKIREKIGGLRYRFRIDHHPLGGIYSPDTWPERVTVIDRFAINIPHDVAPGTYEIRVKMAVKTHYPNYALRDLLADDDVYSGELVARMKIF